MYCERTQENKFVLTSHSEFKKKIKIYEDPSYTLVKTFMSVLNTSA